MVDVLGVSVRPHAAGGGDCITVSPNITVKSGALSTLLVSAGFFRENGPLFG